MGPAWDCEYKKMDLVIIVIALIICVQLICKQLQAAHFWSFVSTFHADPIKPHERTVSEMMLLSKGTLRVNGKRKDHASAYCYSRMTWPALVYNVNASENNKNYESVEGNAWEYQSPACVHYNCIQQWPRKTVWVRETLISTDAGTINVKNCQRQPDKGLMTMSYVTLYPAARQTSTSWNSFAFLVLI